MSWFDQLRTASFRGVPFGVLAGDGSFGRRVAVHEYPYRDKPWIEDLGRSTRRIGFRGFLLENDAVYGGGDVMAQREAMVAAVEQAGPGTLVHPTLGRLTVSCIELHVSERWETGRFFELGFAFLESGERVFPSIDVSTGDAVASAAAAADVAAGQDFLTTAVTALEEGAAVVGQVIDTVTGWVATAVAVVNDATSLINLVGNLAGNFGRYFGGALYGAFVGITSAIGGVVSTVEDLISVGTTLRAEVLGAVDSLTFAAENISAFPSEFVAAAQAVPAALLSAIVNPADKIRLMTQLANFNPNAPTTSDAIGLAMATMHGATCNLFRRAAVVAVARASMVYQPSSYDDAAAVRSTVTALLDNEITVAGDHGEDASYNALRTLRLAVIKDLTTRGASLAPISTFRVGAALPALTLATQLYRDPRRSDQLVTQADPIHPAFMPTSFRALRSPFGAPGAVNADAPLAPARISQLWDQAGDVWDKPDAKWDQ